MAVRLRRVIPLALPLLLGACGGPFPQSSLAPRSDFASDIDQLYRLIVGLAAVVFFLVQGFLLWTIVRYRQKPGAPSPRPVYGHTALEIGWTLAPAVILIVIAVPTIQTIFATDAPPEGEVLRVEVVAKQWWWEFRYPDLGVVTANEMHAPVGRPVEVTITSGDVIHSFWVPRLGGKRDAIGGRTNRISFTADSVGEYLGQCAEFCGVSHANMRFRVYVDEPRDFENWVAGELGPPVEPDSGTLAAQGKAIYARSACIGCHVIQGVSVGPIGPNLTHFGSRRTIAAGLYENTGDELAAWLRDPPARKPGVLMPALGLSDDQIAALVAYLQSLR